jgi:GTPase SAR1 family protein
MTQTMRDLTNDDLWRLSTDINEFNQDGGHITVMRFVLVGPQSAGKTSVIERVTGHSVGYTASGTGTRAPVVYRCTKSPDALSITLAIASVGGHDNESWPSTLHFFDDNLRYKCHDYHDLTDKMQMIMNSIKQDTNDGFSSREIVVTIESPDSPNVEFVDLPGFVSKPSNDAVEQLQKHINSAKLIREYARHSDHFILFCAPAAIQTESDNDFSTIFQLVRETRELKPGVDFMTLCTKADQGRFMDEISGADADPRNMSQVIAERHAVFFSVYPSSKEWNECFFERKREFETGYKDGYLQQFGIKDQDRVLLGVVRARATHWEEQWNRHFGFSQFLAKYDRLWKENFVKGLNKSRAQLREQVEALQAPFDDLLQLRGLNDEYVRREMDDYSRAFCNHFFVAFSF